MIEVYQRGSPDHVRDLEERGNMLADALARILDHDNEDGWFIEPHLWKEPEVVEAWRVLRLWRELP